MLAAADLAPDFTARRSLSLVDLVRLDEPAVIFEHFHVDSDGVHAYVYTVAGWLNGRNVADMRGGATVGGDVIVVHAKSRAEADAMAGEGLQTTIDAIRANGVQSVNAGISTHAEVRPTVAGA